jgi:ketol-acid reductoisomerase
MKVYYDKDCDLSLIKDERWPSSAMAVRGMLMHKTNDSGVKVVVGLRKGWRVLGQGKAGLNVMEVNDAVKAAGDPVAGRRYCSGLQKQCRAYQAGCVFGTAHGFNVHYNQVVPRADLDVWMVAPRPQAIPVRNTYTQGGGVPHLIALYQDRRQGKGWH